MTAKFKIFLIFISFLIIRTALWLSRSAPFSSIMAAAAFGETLLHFAAPISQLSSKAWASGVALPQSCTPPQEAAGYCRAGSLPKD